MTKADLIRALADQHDVNRQKAKSIIEDVFKSIQLSLVDGDSVRITGFGTFEIRRRIARVGRNPRTGQVIQLKPTRTPSFRPATRLKKAVKGKS